MAYQNMELYRRSTEAMDNYNITMTRKIKVKSPDTYSSW
jgi:hypothetical protein